MRTNLDKLVQETNVLIQQCFKCNWFVIIFSC
uniref:Uncharacterized protein n=1 Tax=Arundo donax TaxID=35708 RepID=A0A0A9SZE6_ARUDO